MNAFNQFLTSVSEPVFAALASLPAWLTLVLVSTVSGVMMTWIVGFTSNQKGLRRAADQSRASLLSMKLFKDDLGVTMRAQGRLFKAVGMRLAYMLPSVIVLLLPFTFIASQLGLRYEYRPLRIGERANLQVDLLASQWEKSQNAELAAPEGIAVELRHRDAARRQVSWRLKAEAPTRGVLRIRVGDETVEKRIAVAADPTPLASVSSLRPGTSILDRVLHPAEPAFGADSAVQSIHLLHPLRETALFGLDIHWFITFVVISMLAAFLAAPILKVKF